MAGVVVKSRPIIFSAESVRAILDKCKTQTRRVIKNPQRLEGLMFDGEEAEWCPYGGSGDLLWVRRTRDGKFIWRKAEADLWLRVVKVRVERVQEISRDDAIAEGCGCPTCGSHGWMYGEGQSAFTQYNKTYRQCPTCAKGAKDDGLEWERMDQSATRGEYVAINPTKAYARLWDSLNAKRGYPWANNDWVWPITFEQAEKPA